MRKILLMLWLESYALLLAAYQWTLGVRTDEAKYLLNIPYPHPPLIRYFLSSANSLWMEFVWRFFFATLLIQSVWIIWELFHHLPKEKRWILCSSWLVAGSMILQAGSIMMAPLTALQGLLFVFLLHRAKTLHHEWDFLLISLLWLFSLFTAYQAILFLPILIAIFRRSHLPLSHQLLYIFSPIILLVLYSLTNPLVLASIVNVAEKDAVLTLSMRLDRFFRLVFFSGSGILTILGIVGMFLQHRWEILTTFVLIVAYMFLSHQEYYAILLLPFLIIGFATLISKISDAVAAFAVIGTLFVVVFLPFQSPGNIARETAKALDLTPDDTMLLVGPFGHEWQYYSDARVVRYTNTLHDKDYDAIVCIDACPLELIAHKISVQNVPVPVYQSL